MSKVQVEPLFISNIADVNLFLEQELDRMIEIESLKVVKYIYSIFFISNIKRN